MLDEMETIKHMLLMANNNSETVLVSWFAKKATKVQTLLSNQR